MNWLVFPVIAVLFSVNSWIYSIMKGRSPDLEYEKAVRRNGKEILSYAFALVLLFSFGYVVVLRWIIFVFNSLMLLWTFIMGVALGAFSLLFGQKQMRTREMIMAIRGFEERHLPVWKMERITVASDILTCLAGLAVAIKSMLLFGWI